MLALSLFLAGCTSAHGPTAMGLLIDKEKTAFRNRLASQIGATPDELKRALDSNPEIEKAHASVLTKRVVAKVGRSTDRPMEAYLKQITKKLSRAIASNGLTYDVVLLSDNQINAFTPGAGKILVNEGLLMYCDTEAQMAAVLSHEMAHIVLSHPRSQRQMTLVSKAGGTLMDAITPKRLEANIGKLLRVSGKATLNAFVRVQEAEADSIGMDIMVAAGYDPREMVALQAQLRRALPQISRLRNAVYGNHPLSQDREAAALRKVDTIYKDVHGLVSTPAYDRLVAAYHERLMQRTAEKLDAPMFASPTSDK